MYAVYEILEDYLGYRFVNGEYTFIYKSRTVDIPEDADLSTTGLAVSIKNKSGIDLVVAAMHDYDLRFKKTGINHVTFKFNAYLNCGEYTLTTGLEHRETYPISYFDYIEGSAYINILCDREYFGILKVPSEIIVEEN